MPAGTIPPFVPHPLLKSGHLQTLSVFLRVGGAPAYAAQPHRVTLDDGDRIVLHDDRPETWCQGDRTALLIHGLAGSHRSPYLPRLVAKLVERGVRTFRMDLRTCGAGAGLARHPYHAGRSDDVAAALGFLAKLCPGSPLAVVGFSLGGNIVLKLLGECGGRPPGGLDCGLAVCPPIDLACCVRSLGRPIQRLYDRHFVRLLLQQVRRNQALGPTPFRAEFARPPRSIRAFDERYTAPACGFADADDYYAKSSAARVVESIRVPTLILAARDDPLVPPDVFADATFSASTRVHVARHGGHMGFIAGRSGDADRRWLDWRIVDWLTA